jgi:hypothetical protein
LGERFDIPRLTAAGIVAGAVGLAVLGSGAPLGVYLAALPVFGFGCVLALWSAACGIGFGILSRFRSSRRGLWPMCL